jgi:hypothetical protein
LNTASGDGSVGTPTKGIQHESFQAALVLSAASTVGNSCLRLLDGWRFGTVLAAMESGMATAKAAELQDVNRRLQALVVRLARIIVGEIAETNAVPDRLNRGDAEPNVAARRLQTVSTLRDVAVECAHLARDSLEVTIARELEEISVELAGGAAKLEASLRLD